MLDQPLVADRHESVAVAAVVVDEAGATFGFSWCGPCGALTGVSGPLNWHLGWQYDGDGDLTQFTDPLCQYDLRQPIVS